MSLNMSHDTRLSRILGGVILLALSISACDLSASNRAKVALTRSNMRTISEGLRNFQNQSHTYPLTNQAADSASLLLREKLVPEYMPQLPPDGWSHEYGYWSDGVHCLLMSPGADGRYDLDYAKSAIQAAGAPGTICGQSSPPKNDDLVMFDGQPCIGKW